MEPKELVVKNKYLSNEENLFDVNPIGDKVPTLIITDFKNFKIKEKDSGEEDKPIDTDIGDFEITINKMISLVAKSENLYSSDIKIYFLKKTVQGVLGISEEINEDHLKEFSNKLDDKNSMLTLDFLLSNGNCFFDSLYFMINIKSKNKFKIMATNTLNVDASKTEYCKALLCAYISIMLSGNLKNMYEKGGYEKMPSFIKNVLKFSATDVNKFKDLLSTFNLLKVDIKWVKLVNLTNLPDAFRNRFSLGVAGHRLLKVFAIFTPTFEDKDDKVDNKKYLFNLLSKIAKHLPFWELHPSLNDEKTGNKIFRSFSKNLINLIVKFYPTDLIKKMIAGKILPDREYLYNISYSNFNSWSYDNFKNHFKANIFGEVLNWEDNFVFNLEMKTFKNSIYFE